MKKIDYIEYFENNTKKRDISYRGGVLKIDISGLLSEKSVNAINEAGEEAIAGASQNYLGGGIAGSITNGRQFDLDLLTKSDYKKYVKIAEAIKEYFYSINNGGGDDYMQEESGQNYASVQRRTVSGY